MSTPGEKIAYTDPEGYSIERRVEFGPPRPAGTNRTLRVRDVRDVEDGTVFVQKLLGKTAEARRRAEAEERLETEIRVLLRLVRTFGPDAYPVELERIAGHDFDGAEPFLLIEPMVCPPAQDVAGKLLTDEQEDFRRAMFRAVRYLEAAGVVHGGLSPATVRWQREQRRLHVTDFAHAALAGEPRNGIGEALWAAPGPLRGPGPADPRDDVWSAAQVAYLVTTGRPVAQGRAPAGLETQGVLIGLFQGVFEEDVKRRPGPAELLRRLGEPDPWIGGLAQYDALAEGRRRYESVLLGKREKLPLATQPLAAPAPPTLPPPATPPPATPPRPPQDPPHGRRRRWGRGD